MTAAFTANSFRFLRQLAKHNNREWFQARKDDYERDVRQPFRQLLLALQPALAAISPQFRADPKPVGGSLFRIQRDTRFSGDKAPYKTWQGARLMHVRHREIAAPSFYIHLQPDACFVGAGLWHPEVATLRKIRQFIVDNPGAWTRAAHDKTLRKRFSMESEEMLVRPPAGFPADFKHLDDLRHKNYVMIRALSDDDMQRSDLVRMVAKDLETLAPFVDYLCAALDVEF